MTKDDFFEEFDEVTLLKLQLFRYYIREWLSVFMTDKYVNDFYVLDYFCGPGRDSAGNAGSPIIILEEINKYLENRPETFNKYVSANLFFNDKNKKALEYLHEELQQFPLPHSFNFKTKIANWDFQEAFQNTQDILQSSSPCLAILDQFGIKEVEREVFEFLTQSPKTDILFFITSGNIKRFAEDPNIQKVFPAAPELKEIPKEFVHYGVTQFFRRWIPDGRKYYLAPFTLKKRSNVYGLIFGSSSLYGLEKFLESTWKLDPLAGDSNMNLYNDTIEDPEQGYIFEVATSHKEDAYEDKLWNFISKRRTNHEIYEFGLTSGFLPKHSREILRRFAKKHKIEVTYPNGDKASNFYICWEHYRDRASTSGKTVYIRQI